MNDKEILSLVKKEYRRIKPKTISEFFKARDRRIHSYDTLRKRFGKTYDEIIRKSGISEKEINSVKSVVNVHDVVQETKEELLQKYITYSEKIGRPATYDDIINSNEMHHPGVYMMRFGSMGELKAKAGYNTKVKSYLEEDKERIKYALKKLYVERDRRLTIEEINKSKKLPHSTTIMRKFHTTKINDVWSEIEEEMRCDTHIKSHIDKKKENIKYNLKRLYVKNNRRLTMKEINEIKEIPSTSTIIRIFNTTKITDVWSQIEEDLLSDGDEI